ncbi:MAG: hypothetical protein COA74_12705 [Gammaproteobacteria bacterium]|nr:MAG: hypothetical protein COA74_12705 [Gammaproteobacteria bacterium]
MKYFQIALSEGTTATYALLHMPMYAELRKHSQWPDYLEKSNEIMGIAREKYLRLKAAEK